MTVVPASRRAVMAKLRRAANYLGALPGGPGAVLIEKVVADPVQGFDAPVVAGPAGSSAGRAGGTGLRSRDMLDRAA